MDTEPINIERATDGGVSDGCFARITARVEQDGATIDGLPATITGQHNKTATVAAKSGELSGNYSWEAVGHILTYDQGRFLKFR